MAKPTTPEALQELKSLLRQSAERAPERAASLYETVKSLMPDIQELKAKRFTDSEIRDMFAAKGFEISLGTFRQYLQRANREAGLNPVRTSSKPHARSKKTSGGENARTEANADANAKPKPSEMAVAPRAKAGTGAKATGHRLNDTEL